MQIKRSKEAILTADTYFGIARAFPQPQRRWGTWPASWREKWR